MVRTKSIWIVPLIILLWGINLRSQASDSTEKQGSVYTLRVYQDLVIVDVVVTDKKGNAFKNLKPDNFSLYEDNVPQKISTFDFEDLSTTEPPPGGAADVTALPA